MNFPDSALNTQLRAAIGKPTGDILNTDLVGVGFDTLYATGWGISDLSGLQYCTDLVHLRLWDNNLNDADLIRIAGLPNLRILYLQGNSINTFNALSTMSNLELLSLSDNPLTDLSALSGMTNLIDLNISFVPLPDITPVSGLTYLTYLRFYGCHLTDISTLASLTYLTELDIGRNNISDITALADLTYLTTLVIDSNNITDLSALAGLTYFTTLDVSENSGIDMSTLSGLTGLTSLVLRLCYISDISALAGLTNLTSLDLDRNNINNIGVLAGMPNLGYIDLNNNDVGDITPLIDNLGIGSGDTVILTGNPLNSAAICPPSSQVDTLIGRGATVSYNTVCGGDWDSDGMPDEWEANYGLNPFFNDAAGDLDGDGVSNYDEYLADTDPSNSNSYPRSASSIWLNLNSSLNGNGTLSYPYNKMSTAVTSTLSNGNLYVIGGILDEPYTITQPMTILRN